jgi:hypothetical protein
MVGVLSMKQLGMLTSYTQVYDSLMSLPVSPCGPWTKGRLVREYRHAWWTRLSTLKPDKKFFSTYPDSNQVRDVLMAHFEQLVSRSTFHER